MTLEVKHYKSKLQMCVLEPTFEQLRFHLKTPRVRQQGKQNVEIDADVKPKCWSAVSLAYLLAFVPENIN